MSKKEDVRDDRGMLDPSPEVPSEIPTGLDRRKFIMRSAVISAAAVMNGCTRAETSEPPLRQRLKPHRRRRARRGACRPVDTDLNVVMKAKGPVLTTVDEFYKVGPGPSSSHTIGPMRITYDFYQQAAKLPAASLAKATKLQVNLFGSLMRQARDTVRSEPRSQGWSGKNRPRSTRSSWTACETSLTRCSR